MATKRYLCSIGAIALVWSGGSLAKAADPSLGRLEPQGGQRGTEVQVVAFGARLGDGPHQVLLYEPGIEVGGIETVDANQVKCILHLSENCRVGRHALRLRTASGLSNLVTFHVGSLSEIQEAEPNNGPDQLQEISTDVVVNGVVKSGDVDVYAVDLAEGERLSVEIEGLRLGRTLFDPVILLQDITGNLLASSDDQPAAHQDAFVSIRAGQAGRVLILVRESAQRGSDAATYRLHVGRFPRPVAVYPPAVVAGQPAELRWIGDTFDDGQTVAFAVPQTDEQTYEVHATDEQGIAPSGLPLHICKATPHLEVEPNNSREQANEVTAPGVACGVISEPNDKDFYRFPMKQGDQWDFRVRARELRSPLDAVLHLYNSEGKYLAGNDDDRGRPDSYLRFKAPADGDYYIDVEDRLLRGRKEMTYVVDITKPSPIADLTLDERRRYRAQVINIPQGSRTAAMMTVTRRDFGGPLQLNWTDLPAGSAAEAVPLAANFNRVPVLFTAGLEAELGASLATITAQLTNENPPPLVSRFRQQTWLVRGRNNVQVWSHFAQRAPVAVTQALPYTIRMIEPKAPLVRGGSMELKIVAARNEGFENAIAIRTIYNPPGMSTNQSRSIPKGQNEALIPVTANGSAWLGEWKIVFLGNTSVGGAVETSTQLATLRIAEPYFDVAIPTLTIAQGNTAELVVPLTHRTPFEGDAELELIRLPPGVTAEKVQVQAGGESAVFQLTVAKDARVGRHRGVGCHITLTVEDEPVRYSQGYVELHVDPSPDTKTAASETGPEDKAS